MKKHASHSQPASTALIKNAYPCQILTFTEGAEDESQFSKYHLLQILKYVWKVHYRCFLAKATPDTGQCHKC